MATKVNTKGDVFKNILRIEVINTFFSRNVVLLLVLINLTIAIPISMYINIDADEAYSLESSSKGPKYALARALNVEKQAPLYFIILSIWRSLNSSIFFARLFSVLCISLSIYFTAKVSRRIFETVHPGLMSGIIALNPFVIWAAVTIRLYALSILLTILLILFYYDGYVLDKRHNDAKYYYVLTSVLGLYTQYYIGVILVANAFALLALKRRQILATYLLQMLFVAITFSPLLFYLPSQIRSLPAIASGSLDIPQNIIFAIQRFENYLLPMKQLPIDRLGRWIIRTFILTFFYIFGIKVFKNSYLFLNRKITIVLIIVTVIYIVFFIALIFFGKEVLLKRHTTFLFFPSILFMFSVLQAMDNRKLIKSFIFFVIFVYAYVLVGEYEPMAKSGDFSRVASYIKNREQAAQSILVFPQDAALAFAYHYKGVNKIIAIPRPISSESWAINNSVLKDEKEIKDAINNSSIESEILWVIRYPTNEFMGVKYRGYIFDNFICKYYTVQEMKTFYKGTKVLLIKKSKGIKNNICSEEKLTKN